MQTYAPTTHAPVPLTPLCTGETEGCGPINVLYVGTCPLIALADSDFLFRCLPLYGGNAKIDPTSVSGDTVCV